MAASRHDAVLRGAQGASFRKEVTVAAKREAAAYLQACQGMSERRACRVIDANRNSVRYHFIRDDDGALRENLRDLPDQRRRFEPPWDCWRPFGFSYAAMETSSRMA